MSEISTGLWKTKSEKGNEYYRGTKNGIEIDGKKYKVALFITTNKKSENSPDMTLKLSEIKSETKEEVQIPQNATSEYDNTKSDVILTDADLPF